MKKSIFTSLGKLALLLSTGTGTASGGIIFMDFNGLPDGATTGFSNGAVLTSNDQAEAQVIGGRLRMTQNTTSNSSAFHLPAVPDETVGFRVWFDYEMNSPAVRPADGFSFSYGNIPFDELSGQAEEGWPGNSPVISWEVDTWNSSTNEFGTNIAVDGTDVAANNGEIIPSGGTISGQVHIELRPDGTTDFSTTGATNNAAFNNVASGFALNANHSFAIAARTGGSFEELYIDNLTVQWIPEPSSSAVLGSCLGALLLLHRRK